MTATPEQIALVVADVHEGYPELSVEEALAHARNVLDPSMIWRDETPESIALADAYLAVLA